MVKEQNVMILEEEGATVHEICVLVQCGCGREDAQWREIDHIRAFMRVANLYGNTGKEKIHYVSWVTPWQRKCLWRMK